MRRAAWLALVTAGCNQVLGVTDPHLHDGGALGSDGMTDGSAACPGDGFGYPISNVAPCDIPAAPMMAPLIVNSTIDTTAGTVTVGTSTQPLPATALVPQLVGSQMVRVVSVPGFRVPPGITVNVVGQYPLVIVVRGDVVIDGTVNASADHTTPAAGSRTAAACGASAGATGAVGAGGSISGAGGGGHGGSGAAGGNATSIVGNTIPGGTGGIADTNMTLRPLRGGCPGGVRAGDPPAAGGGAIQISASGRIDISGTIAAAGGGAVARDTSAPAPAGGAGGGILLEAGTIAMTATAAVTANGGAGADGADKVSACSGDNGHPRDDTPAAGGSCNGDPDITGGAGGTGTMPAHGGDAGARGTGGGGGVGRIAIHSHTFTRAMGSVVSPAPNIEPF